MLPSYNNTEKLWDVLLIKCLYPVYSNESYCGWFGFTQLWLSNLIFLIIFNKMNN